MCPDVRMECFRIKVGMCPDFLEPVDDRAIESFSGGLASSRPRVIGLRPSSADSRVAERSPRQGTGPPWLWARCERFLLDGLDARRVRGGDGSRWFREAELLQCLGVVRRLQNPGDSGGHRGNNSKIFPRRVVEGVTENDRTRWVLDPTVGQGYFRWRGKCGVQRSFPAPATRPGILIGGDLNVTNTTLIKQIQAVQKESAAIE